MFPRDECPVIGGKMSHFFISTRAVSHDPKRLDLNLDASRRRHGQISTRKFNSAIFPFRHGTKFLIIWRHINDKMN